MSEPESLDTHEPLTRRLERHWFDRLIMLSDGVFAIAMTLLALEVRPPHEWNGDMLDLLAQSWRALFGFALSFLVIAFFWVNNRAIVARLQRVDGPYTALTLILLCLICLTPFGTALVAEHGPNRAMRFYSFLVAASGVAQALLWGYAALLRDLVYPEIGRGERWFRLAGLLLIPLMFCVVGLTIGAGTSQWTMMLVIVVAAGMGQLRRRLMRRIG
ncbi:TMEM175 family protein [Sphingomonas sp. KR3-1]|uniref:TMEM175 family protein n=1 Tax=Sphingomonas sp. KR3-1 TaxID=3156611 RepID=UPI0032B5F7E4